jgi:hypothetical protein
MGGLGQDEGAKYPAASGAVLDSKKLAQSNRMMGKAISPRGDMLKYRVPAPF